MGLSSDHEVREARDWLSAPGLSSKHLSERQKHVQGTGQWLFSNEAYVWWEDHRDSTLWLNGSCILPHVLYYNDKLTRDAERLFYDALPCAPLLLRFHAVSALIYNSIKDLVVHDPLSRKRTEMYHHVS